jgi:polyphosphate kinase
MPRNLDKRIELLFPVESPEGRHKVLSALEAILQDNVKGRRLQADGTYKRRRPARGEEAYRSQVELHREAKRALDRVRAGTGITLEPLRSPSE